jgi:hypothetical protein
MNNRTHIATTNLGLALAAMLCIGMPSGALAAEAAGATDATAAAPAPASRVEELGEIRVYGKRLAARIENAEDDFFKLYNKLNSNHDYDITCGDVALDPWSMILTRVCVPEFVAASAMHTLSMPGYYEPAPPGPLCNSVQAMAGGTDASGHVYYQSATCTPLIPAIHYSSTLSSNSFFPVTVSEDFRKGYRDNVLAVMTGDPQLLAKGVDLALLYGEMESVQRGVAEARKSLKKARPSRGPRIL